MAIEGSGDKLASGRQKSATFQGGFGDGEMRGVSTAEETCLCENRSQPGSKANPLCPDHGTVVDNSASLYKKPAVTYRGRPFFGRVLVVRVERQSNSTIIIPDSARGKSDVGRIVKFCPESQLEKYGLRQQAMILFDKFASVGQEFPLLGDDGKEVEHLLLMECDVQMELEEIRTEEIPSVQ